MNIPDLMWIADERSHGNSHRNLEVNTRYVNNQHDAEQDVQRPSHRRGLAVL
jgi:hypothetical protein